MYLSLAFASRWKNEREADRQRPTREQVCDRAGHIVKQSKLDQRERERAERQTDRQRQRDTERHTHTETEGGTERQRHTDRQRDRKRQRQRQRDTQRETERDKRQKDRDRHRQRQTDRERERDGERDRLKETATEEGGGVLIYIQITHTDNQECRFSFTDEGLRLRQHMVFTYSFSPRLLPCASVFTGTHRCAPGHH